MIAQEYLVNAGEGLRLAVPPDWKRSAVVVFSNGHDGEEGASVVARRESLDPRIGLQQYMDGLLVELARTLPAFSLLERRQRTISGASAGEFIYILTAKGMEYQQRQICVIDAPGSVLSLVLSSGRKRAPDFSDLWEQILDSATLVPIGPAAGHVGE